MSNDNFIRELQKIYNEGNIVPFIGAGLSIPFNIPDWGKLIRDCAIHMGIENVDGTSFIGMIDFSLKQYDYWEAVRIIKKYLNRTEGDIQEYIVNTINSKISKDVKDENNNYSDISKYGFDIFLTTNYDHILQKYLDTNYMPINLKDVNSNMQSLITQKGNKRIFHLHGHISDSSSIVISEEKYMELYNNDKYKTLFSLFTGVKTFLFIGFSFNDVFIQRIIKDNNHFFNSKHYIILPNATKENIIWLKQTYNIETIAYDPNNSSHHEEIRKIMKKICENNRLEIQNLNLQKDKKNKANSIYNLPPENLLFTGRTDLLKNIQRSLNQSPIFIINGIAGIGKTQIVKQYAYCNLDEYNNIYWINAEDKSRLNREYTLLASYLNLNVHQDERIIVESIKKFFEDGEKNLIIYDNADEIDLDELKKFFPRKGVEIIVTTKNLNWDLEKINNERIKYFTEYEAKAFLFNNSDDRCKEVDDEENCISLGKELMYYPLALEQARAYINKKKISFAEYLSLFNEYRFKLMGKKALDYNHTVLTTFKISFDKLREKNNKSLELLALCAFINHDNIPIHKLFLANKQFDKLELDDIIDDLMSYSLLDIKNEFIYTHGIIQEIMRNELEGKNEKEEYVNKIAKIIIDAFPDEIGTQDNINSAAQLIGHTITVYEYLSRCINSEKMKIEIAKRIGITLYDFGQFSNAISYLNDCAEYYKESNEVTVYSIILERLGIAYHRIGKSKNALDLLYEALKTIQDTNSQYGQAIILRSIGIVYKDIGERDLALDYHEESLILARRLKDNNLIVNQLLNIGIIYKNNNDYIKAQSIYDEVELILNDIKETKLKGKLYGNKGFIYRQLGNKEDAFQYFSKALDIFKKLRDETSIAITLDHIGSNFIDWGIEKQDIQIIKRSLEYFNESIEICKKNGYKWGEANTLLNIGTYYHYINNKPKAIKYFEQAQLLGKEIGHRQVVEICNSNLQMISTDI